MKSPTFNPRIICGLLSEIEASSTLAFCTTTKNEKDFSVHRIQVELKHPYETSSITLNPPLPEALFVECLCNIGRRRIAFRLSRNNSLEEFKVPKEIEILDLRAKPRLKFLRGDLVCEARFLSGVLLGRVNDISADHLAMEVSETIKDPTEIYDCEVIVRSSLGNKDLFFSKAKLIATILTESGYRLVFRTGSPNTSKTKERRANRHNISLTSLRFRSDELLYNNLSGEIQIEQVSLTGFFGRLVSSNVHLNAIMGLVLVSDDPNIRFYAVRESEGQVAFKVVESDSSILSADWSDFVEKHALPEYRSLLDGHELAEIFTDSLLLKGERRKKYGREIENHFVHLSRTTNRHLMRRFVLAEKDSEVSHHLSVFRFSDFSWYVQEVTSGINKTQKSTIISLRNRAISQLSGESHGLPGAPGYLCGIYDPKIIVNAKCWGETPSTILLNSRHIIMSHESSKKNLKSKIDIIDVEQLNFQVKLEIAKQINQPLVQLLDFFAKGTSNRTLLSELARIGSAHRAKLFAVFCDGQCVGLAYRIHTHYSASITGVLNSLFLFPLDLNNLNNRSALFESVSQNDALRFSTSDILFVSSNSKVLDELPNGKDFIWFISDLQLNDVARVI